MTSKATVSMGWVNMVIAAAQRQGVAADHLLTMAGLPAKVLEWERWPIDYITRLWRAAERCTGDTGFGLKVGGGVTPAAISGLGFVLQSAATLREALSLVQKYQRLISDGGRFQMLTGESATWVVYHPQQGQLAFSPHQIEAVLAAVVNLASWLRGSTIHPTRVQFSQPALGPESGYRETFGCAVKFEQAFSGLLLDNACMDQPLPQADPKLAQVHQQYTAARLAALEINSVSVNDVRQWLAERMGPTAPKRAELAQALGLSQRTVARRLAEQGVTYEGLLDDVRREMALQAVADPERALAEIAQSLGFAEASTFYRAFQRWTKMPPARWRRNG